MIRSCSLLLASVAAMAASPALAQEDRGQDDELIVSVGVGPQLVPSYPGAEDFRLAPLFTGNVRREGQPLAARGPDDGFGISLTGRGGPIEFGPMIQFQIQRDQEDVGAAVGDVDFAFEPGLFVNFNLSPSFRLRGEVRKGIGGHEGFVGDIGADFFARGPNTVFSIGPRLRLADQEYMQTYYGISPGAAAASGLAAFAPDGGVHAAGAIAGLTHQLSRSFGIYAYAGYDRLVGDAADSPIVRQLGSRDQFSGGIALYYTFRMRNPFR